jgi:uncharacterized protein (DUF4213/DUF364 family)
LIEAMNRPSAVIEEVAIGSRFIGIRAVDDGTSCSGLASTLGAAPRDEEHRLAETLVGEPLIKAAERLKSSSPFSISIGAAALNAGIIPPENQPDIEASRIMAEKGKAGETVLVGDFPFTEQLRREVETLHLFELRDVPGRAAPSEWNAILGRCNVLGLTGTTLITRAMAAYLNGAPQAYTIIIGPTTPLSPVLFEHGADVLAGCEVVSPGPVFDGIREGMSFRQIKKLGVRFVAWSGGRPA